MTYDWAKVDEEKLKRLYYDEQMTDRAIAQLYGVEISKVRYKRNKYGISIRNQTMEEFFGNKNGALNILNNGAKNRLLQVDKIDFMSKVLTRYLFRDGPIEDMHSQGKLSQDDMKELNKFMVNKIAGILKMVYEEQWIKIESLTQIYRDTEEWDEAKPDTETIEEMFRKICLE